ncbi:hypothetical protein [Nesterenkonia pannonica]|uniref:hypothetical protein n=1 Tax=Nesterenkonia pannonica TaxID=1548602 RepID=UPI0021649DFA|nr:hypothetical protein [Nesterenkonia pannonica]
MKVSDEVAQLEEQLETKERRINHLDHLCDMMHGRALSAEAELGWLQEARQATVPRVITADELREGQWVAMHGPAFIEGVVFLAGRVTAINAEFAYVNDGIREDHMDSGGDCTIVLLADAPAEQQEAHAKEPDTSPGHAKNEAETCNVKEPATAETIRASEAGSVWKRGTMIRPYEWTGEKLVMQLAREGLGRHDQLDQVDHEGDWTRTDAPPRGDYGKRNFPRSREV